MVERLLALLLEKAITTFERVCCILIAWYDPIFMRIFDKHEEKVQSEHIFPLPDNGSIEYLSKGGSSKISSLRA